MKIVLIDLDGPLANLESKFLEIWRKRFPEEFFVPVEKRGTLYLSEEYPESLKEKTELVTNETGFFINLPPVPGSVNAVKNMVSDGFSVFICTAGIYKNDSCLNEKKLWIEKYLGIDLARTAIFTRDKTIIKGDYLIDDRSNITGAVVPEWEHIIFDQPHNRNIKDKPRIKIDWSNWQEIVMP